MKRNKLIGYFVDSYTELKKVSWPKRDRLIRDTFVVIISSVVFTVVIGAIDYGLFTLLQYFISLKG